jgi:hypothetical protein
MQPRTVALAIAIAGIMVLSLLGSVGVPSGAAPAEHSTPNRLAPAAAHFAPATGAAGRATASELPRVAELAGAGLAPLPHSHPLISLYTIIAPDGTVTGSAPITQAGNLYTLTGGYSGAIVDERNGSTFQGAGYTITTTVALGFGFQVNTTRNVLVNDLLITGEEYGVEVLNSTNVTITRTTANAATEAGFLVESSTDVSCFYDFSNSSVLGFEAVLSSTIYFEDSTANTETTDAFELEYVTFATVQDDEGEHAAENGFVALESSDIEAGSDTFSFAGEDGIDLALTPYSDVYGSYAETCHVGLLIVASTEDGAYDSNFSYATYAGAEIVTSSYPTLSGDVFFEAGNTGLLVNHGYGGDFSELQANSSGVNGIDLRNLSSVDLTDAYANHNGWNGLFLDNDEYLASTGVTADWTADGNGTFLGATAEVTIDSNFDDHEPAGLFDAESHDLEVSDSNASFDTNGFGFVEDVDIEADHDVAFGDGTGYVLSSATGFFLESDNASTGSLGFEEVEGVSGDLWFSSAYDCTAGYVVFEDAGSFYYGDEANASASGLVAEDDTDTTFEELDISGGSTLGVEFIGTTGLWLYFSTVSYSAYGIALAEVAHSEIYGNTFAHDTDDFFAAAANLNDVQLYWNNFVDGKGWKFNPVGGTASSISFNASYPTGGNYWSNWTTPDTMKGPGQNIPGSDGIVDTPLPIGGSYRDQYPLTSPFAYENTSVTFTETGLPSGTGWGVQFDVSQGGNSTGTDVYAYTNAAAWATYNYSVYAPAGWTPSPGHGTVTTNGAPLTVTINFTPVTYTTTFSETGLATGASWNVTVDGKVYTGSGPTIAVPLANGTYNYSVTPIPGYYSIPPSSGSVIVSAHQQTVAVVFMAVVYTITFTEAGLSSGTTWSVTFGGRTADSSASTLSFSVGNGSYAYSVAGVSGYSLVPSTGTQQVSGAGATVGVAFSSNSSSTPGGVTAFWALLALVILLAIVVALLLVRGRKKPAAAPAVAGWAPPAPGATAPAATPGPAGGPPPGAVGPPPPPPSWKET